MLTEYLKAAIPFEVMESSQFEGIEDTLLVSIPNTGNNNGLALLEKGRLYCFAVPACTGMWLCGERLYIALAKPDCMIIRIYEQGHDTRTIVSSSLCDVHDIRVIGDALHVVSTGTNEVAVVDNSGRISKSWRMQGFGDASHLNCLDVWDDRLVATAFGSFTTYRGYKGRSRGKGIILDVKTQEIIFNGLSSPHTPRRDQDGGIYICDSAAHSLTYNKNGSEKKITFPGAFPRGLAVTEKAIYCGLSSLRHRKDLPGDISITTSQLVVVDKGKFETTRQITLPQAEIYEIIALSPSS